MKDISICICNYTFMQICRTQNLSVILTHYIVMLNTFSNEQKISTQDKDKWVGFVNMVMNLQLL